MLSIIIVNYRTPQLLVDCIQSVYDTTTSIEFEVIVVDNDSRDDSHTRVTSRFPSVRWISLNENAGFARANNRGMEKANGNTYLLLNSDTVVTGDSIAGPYLLLNGSDYIACGVQLVNKDGSAQISGSKFMAGAVNNLLPLPYVGAFIRSIGLLAGVKKPHAPESGTAVEVDWINGAYLMVKKSVVQQAGKMDEDFFLYAEEAEWCHRLGKFGKLVIYGQFKVIHLQGESSKTAFTSDTSGYNNLYDSKGFQIMLSNFVRIRKQLGNEWFLIHLLTYTFTIPVFFLAALFKWIVGSQRGDLGKASAFSKNVFRLWSYARKVMSNRPYFYKAL